jgi:SAM-dependent methyltransferase
VSWYQKEPATSLALIKSLSPDKAVPIIDVGGGASLLVDHLLADGYHDLTVLDISAAALAHARERLGDKASLVHWVESSVTQYAAPKTVGIWHDRAVFHFLTAPEDRELYRSVLMRTLEKGGHAIISTFALDGPLKCSGLEVVRYDAAKITAELGDGFSLVNHFSESHTTPWDTEQKFNYFVLVRN